MNGRHVLAALTAALVLVTTGCTDTGAPPPEPGPVTPKPAGASELTEPPEAAPAPADCGDPTARSYRPRGALPTPGQLPPGSTMDRIHERAKLVVGVDQNTFNFGYRDPFTGEIEGFDIDMARAIAQAIFGDPKAVQLRVITSAQRIPVLQEGSVDIVIRTMTVNCERLEDVDFSSVYYESGQKVLVKKDSDYTGLSSLGGKKVCAAQGSTSLRNIADDPANPIPVQVQNWTDCLVMLQQYQVDAVSTDDTILAGLRAQDPHTHVVGDPIHREPYGMAMPKGQEDFVRFVNGIIQQLRTDGRWMASYDKWMAPLLGPSAGPPQPKYRD